MTKKDIFVSEINAILANGATLSEDAAAYFETLKSGVEKDKPPFTDNGKIILTTMKENKESAKNLFKSSTIAEKAGLTTRTVSGAIRKLVSDGYVAKVGADPIIYALTDKGDEVVLT